MVADQSAAARAQQLIAWGSSTCSKSVTLPPEEPALIVRGRGCRVWDTEGREFIDFRNGLGPVSLGYGYPAVIEAVTAQLHDGIVFGHPHPLEGEVAQLLVDRIPCAEMVRYLKTGGEAAAAAIRLARAYTGRDHIIQIGYHGWLSNVGSGARPLPGATTVRSGPTPGVPEALSALHHVCAWNDIAAVEQVLANHPVAAVVVAADYARMADGATFYPGLREATQRYGALLVHDEIVTGFRIALGGAQEFFDVVPDLAVFSKGMANGFPISAVVGRRQVMERYRDVIVSSTFGGDAVALAAAKATIETYDSHDVVAHLWRQGETLWTGLNAHFARTGIPGEVRGFWPCPILVFDPPELKDRFLRAAYAHGVSLYLVSYVNLSHTDADIAEALDRLGAACAEVAPSL